MKSKPFKMKNASLAKAMKDGSPMQANYGSPAKIDLTKGFKKMYDTGKELYDKGKEVYDKLPKGVQKQLHPITGSVSIPGVTIPHIKTADALSDLAISGYKKYQKSKKPKTSGK